MIINELLFGMRLDYRMPKSELMKKLYNYLVIMLTLVSMGSSAQNFNWTGYTPGSSSYSTSSVNVTMTASVNGTGLSTGYPYGSPSSTGHLTTSVDWWNKTSKLTFTISFSTPLKGVNFYLYDVDESTGYWDDRIVVTGTSNTGATIYPVITGTSYASVSGYNNNILEGHSNNPSFTSDPALVNFGGSAIVQSFTITYSAGWNSPSNPVSQVIGIGTINSSVALPVDLLGFSAVKQNGNAFLKWETDNQVKFDHFEVERSATGNGDFERLTTVKAQSGLSGNYNFTDYTVRNSMAAAYYRLKMVDIGGAYTYSKVVMLQFSKGVVVDVKSTLLQVGQPIQISVTGGHAETFNLAVYSMNGARVYQQKQAAQGTVSIATNNLTKGMYVVKAEGTDINESIRVILQ